MLIVVISILLVSGCATQELPDEAPQEITQEITQELIQEDIIDQIQMQVDDYVAMSTIDLCSNSCKCSLFDISEVNKSRQEIILRCYYATPSSFTKINETHDLVQIQHESSGGSRTYYDFEIFHFEPIKIPSSLTLIEIEPNNYQVVLK